MKKAIYYLCSGFGMEHSFANKFGELLAGDLKKRNNLVIIPCTDDVEEMTAHSSFFAEQLAEAGIRFEVQTILTRGMQQEEMQESIEQADLIYFSGGYPFTQKEFIKEYNLSDSLRKYSGVILGISAGAMNISKYIIMVTDGVNSDESRVEEGLALVDFSVFPHCAFSGDIFAKSFYIGTDLVDSEKLLAESLTRGEVYFLQNKTETNKLKVSFIRVADSKKEFVSMYDGRVWKAAEGGFELMKEYTT